MDQSSSCLEVLMHKAYVHIVEMHSLHVHSMHMHVVLAHRLHDQLLSSQMKSAFLHSLPCNVHLSSTGCNLVSGTAAILREHDQARKQAGG